MQGRRGEPTPTGAAEPGLRLLLRRLRELMAAPGDGQQSLDRIVRQVALMMVAEVCSIYIKRQDGSLELFATEGLKAEAVHQTHLKRGEGLVGRCAELGVPINEPDAQEHPAFSYRPETGEEIYHSFLAVPIRRARRVLGVITVQNQTRREYTDDDLEILETTAMVLAEYLVSEAAAGLGAIPNPDKDSGVVVDGQAISEGIALGHAVLHVPRVVVTQLTSDDPDAEMARLETAVGEFRAAVDELVGHDSIAEAGEHRDVLEAYRMFAYDRGWVRRLRNAVESGLTAEAAVEQVQNQTRARMLANSDAFWRDRVRDLDELSDRLLRVLSRGSARLGAAEHLPADAIIVARSMGPADLLDYERSRLRGLIIEDGGGQSHVAIVAKALGIPAVGQARGAMDRVLHGDPIILDADSGQVHVRPGKDVIQAYRDKIRFRARRQDAYKALRDTPAATKDHERIELLMNAGLLFDMPHLAESGAEGIGLFRTELEFMLSASLPRLDKQTQAYRAVVEQADGKPVVFRAIDVGSDKTLPYLRPVAEANPALGWRGIRMLLDQPGLFRTQVRALLRATAGRELRILLPMISAASEIDTCRSHIEREIEIARTRQGELPSRIEIGAMIEVPSLLFELDRLMASVDFVSVGSNDLLQYLFAADRTNERVAGRYDTLDASALRVMREIVMAADAAGKHVTLCGEMAGRPLEAMTLVGLGFRSLSMPPASIGPVKAMLRALDCKLLSNALQGWLAGRTGSLRDELQSFASSAKIPL